MNRKPLNQPRKAPKPDVPVNGFQVFKNGYFNLHPPRSYNWALGHVTPAPESERRQYPSIGLSTKTVNGQRVV